MMKQTWENGKKPNFGLNFDLFGAKFGPQKYFHGFYPYYMLYIVVSYHCMQYQGKLMHQTGEN